MPTWNAKGSGGPNTPLHKRGIAHASNAPLHDRGIGHQANTPLHQRSVSHPANKDLHNRVGPPKRSKPPSGSKGKTF